MAPAAGIVDGLRDKLLEPFTIGALRLDRRLVMAPMAGITMPAFRHAVRRWGAGLVFTEMISAHGVDHENPHTIAYLACDEDEHPIGFQLFAADPAALGRAAGRCVAAGADLVDLNLACPVRKVMRTGAGAALLRTPELAEACVKAAVEAVEGRVPVTVKIRSGVTIGDEAGRRLAPRLVAAGAAAVCIHPRYAAQLYRGEADHSVTLALALELDVPVIASGDIATTVTARPAAGGPGCEIDRATSAGLLDGGVAAVMVARAALGRPWVFRELLDGGPPPPPDERLADLCRFVADAEADLGPRAVRHLRQFWGRYRRSGTVAPPVARALMTAPDIAAVHELLAACA